MADDYIGVPRDEWANVRGRATDAWWIAFGALCLAILIVMTLIEKGTLASWAELFRHAGV